MGVQASRVRVVGPLAAYASGFAAELSQVGYREKPTADQVRLLAHLSRWLANEALRPAELTAAAGDAFLLSRRAAGYTLWLSRKALQPTFQYLRGIDVVPAEPVLPSSLMDALLGRYQNYLITERGLSRTTIRGYVDFVRPFLRRRQASDGSLRLNDLTVADVTAYVVAEIPGRRVGSAKLAVTALRSLLGFLHVDGFIDGSLASAVPSVCGSRLSGLPKAVPQHQVQQLLRGCDRSTAVGKRDFAVLTMLVRLGVRAGEVAALELNDVNWRTGEIVVRGKGDRRESLPLPVDVGRALATYLRHGRPAADSRRVFLRVRAPWRALTSHGVSAIVINAAHKAGLPPMGAHRLRHTTATELLRAGASLVEIGQLLRHRRALSTAIYAKVDRIGLRELAGSWPSGGVR